MRWKLIAGIGLAAALSSGCKCSPDKPTSTQTKQAAKSKSASRSKPGSEEVEPGIARKVEVGSTSAEYTVHVPAAASAGEALPALVFLLDHGQSPLRFPDRYNVVHGADKLKYILALVPAPGGKRAHWAHGLCAASPESPSPAASASPAAATSASAASKDSAPSASAALSDVAFVGGVIEDLTKEYKVDPAGLTIMGVGEGASMAHQAAAALPKITSLALFNPSARCAAPSGPNQPESGRSVLIVSHEASAGRAPDGGTEPPTLARLISEAWSAAGKCKEAPADGSSKHGATVTRLSCDEGRVIEFVDEPKSRRGWPVKTAGTYTMRAIQNFLRQK